MTSQLRMTFDLLEERARTYVGDAGRWGERHLPGGARTVWIGIGLGVTALVLWAVYPQHAERTGRFGMMGPQPVGVAKVEVGDLNVSLNALGTVTPLASVTVRPQVSGQIVKFDFQEGQMVKAGDVLAEIDPRPFEAALNQAKGQLARDSAALANAKVDLGRFQNLWNAKAVSQQQFATQGALVKQDEGVVAADQANVQTASINLGYTKIAAPVAGRVGLRQVDVGNLVQVGQASGIAVVTQLQPISVLFSLPEDNIADIMRQVNAGATLGVDAYDRNQVQKLSSGKLAAVDTEIDTTTGTVKMRAMFDNGDNALFPNQFVNVRLLVNTLHDQAIVPGAAIQRGAEGTYVFVVNADSTASMRTVSLGPADGDHVAITKGLKRGDVVVVDGADRLRDGASVSLPKGQHGNGTAAESSTSATPGAAPDSRAARRALFMKLMPKMTQAEREALRAMTHDQRAAWIKAHKDELMKRKDQPGFDSGSPQ
jgi:multidrug efflux system membrane fusion protein